jgi:ABC-2 type transport system permease protein
MLLKAMALFQVSIAGSLFDLFLVLTFSSIAFISIGLFITNFMDTQATAVLSSLLVIIPLLFLGGIIFPKEFMPSLIAEFAKLLPLYITNELLIAVMTKGASILLLANQVGILLALSAVLLAFTLANKKI